VSALFTAVRCYIDIQAEAGRAQNQIRGKTAAISGMLVMLLITVTAAYAASEYIQIRNKEGVVKVQHYAENPNPGPPAPYYKYAWKLMDFAKPGN
jgi:hypothetical protein